MAADPVRRYLAAKEQDEKARRESDRAAGVVSHLLGELREGFGCGSIAEAEKLLAELEVQETAAAKALDRAVRKYELEFADAHDDD